MGFLHLVVVLVAIISSPLLMIHRASADDFLAPLLSPVINGLCHVVQCGKGTCEVSSNHTLGFVCNCNPGWSQFQFHNDDDDHDHLRFLPCIIPNCSINYSCYNDSVPVAPPPESPPPSNLSLLDPCTWSYCGGGTCVKKSQFEHQCLCKEGFSNLLNITSFPCYKDCAIGADCASLGITLSNSSASSPSSFPDQSPNSSSSSDASSSVKNMLWLVFLTVSVAMAGAN